MEMSMYWVIFGIILVLLEVILPGGIIVFLGFAALFVGLALHLGFINTVAGALIAWFISSLFLVLVLRSFFMKYFEGDSKVDDVDESKDVIGAIVEVCEEVLPHKEGRVRFRGSTWQARSEEEFPLGSKVRVVNQDGSTLIVKSI